MDTEPIKCNRRGARIPPRKVREDALFRCAQVSLDAIGTHWCVRAHYGPQACSTRGRRVTLPPMPTPEGDFVIRALTDDGSFRVLTARTTSVCAAAVARQKVSGTTARHFGDLLTGTVLVRETMAPQLRVQGIVRGA